MKCRDEEALNCQLGALPKDLDATYANILQQSDDPDALKILLQWLAFSKEPLSVSALAEVLAVDFSGCSGPTYNPDIRFRTGPEFILRICDGLVTNSDGAMQSSLT